MRVPSQEGAESLQYAFIAVNSFVDPAQVGEIHHDISASDRAGFVDVNTAILAVQKNVGLSGEDVEETSNVIPLIAQELTKIAGEGLKGRLRFKRAGAFLWGALATAEYPGQEPWRYDPSLPNDIGWTLELGYSSDTRFGLLSKAVAQIAGV